MENVDWVVVPSIWWKKDSLLVIQNIRGMGDL